MPKYLQTSAMVVVLALLATGAILAVRHNDAVGRQSSGTGTLPDKQYVSTAYGFSFSFPPEYSLKEYTPQYVEMTEPTTQSALADVTVEKADANTSFKSFDEFAQHQASLTCDADGPTGSVRCPGVSRSEVFKGSDALVGQVFYMTYIVVSNGATTTREAGPYYAFDISGNIPESKYALLLIRPVHPAEESSLHEQGALLAQKIVDSLKVSVLTH